MAREMTFLTSLQLITTGLLSKCIFQRMSEIGEMMYDEVYYVGDYIAGRLFSVEIYEVKMVRGNARRVIIEV